MNTNNVPTPPKGIGISRRLLFTMAGFIVLMMLLFLIFLHQSTQHRVIMHKEISDMPVDATSAESLIQQLTHTPHQPFLIPAAIKQHDNPHAVLPGLQDQPKAFSDNDFKQGSDAEISAYQNVMPVPNQNNASADVDTSDNNSLAMYASTHPNAASDTYAMQNGQSEKTAFLQSSHSTDKDYVQSQLKNPISPYEIKAGTIIPATLMTGINSDLPGTIIAKVSRDVFDTVTGNYLLIPQGTTLMGVYDSQIAYGQSRVLIAWSRLIFPNGNSFDLEGQPGVDLIGMSGLHDLVNNHYFRIFSSALLFSSLGAVGQLSQPKTTTDQLTTQQIMYSAIGQQMSQTGAQLIEKNMNIQPTIEIRPGTDFNVLLTRDMVLSQSYQF